MTRPGTPRAAWREVPFVTALSVHGTLRIAGINAAAGAAGVAPGLPLADARALCPALKAVEADPAADAAALDHLADWARRWTPWTAVDGLDDSGAAALWLDVTGCAHLFAKDGMGDEEALLTDLLERLSALGFEGRAGLADTKGAAWAAARFLDRDRPFAVIPEGGGRQILPSLPVEALRLAADVVETLRRLGLRTIGDLMALPRAPLVARLGRPVAERLDQALGRSPEPFTPRTPPAPYRARMGFPEPLGLVEDVAAGVLRLLEALCGRLERDGQGARHLVLEAFRVDGAVSRTALGTARPVRDPAHLARLFRERLDTLDAGFGIEALMLSIPVAEPLQVHQTDLARNLDAVSQGATKEQELGLLIDRIGGRLGLRRVFRPLPHPSHIPENAVRPAGPLKPLRPESSRSVRSLRPPHLLPQPEPVEASAAPSDAPPPFAPPPRGDGLPVHLRWRRQILRVVRAEGPERIAAEWWHDSPPPGPESVRDYWRIEDARGRRLWLFASGGTWYVHGILP